MMLHHFCTASKNLSIDTKLASVGSKLVTLDKMAAKMAAENVHVCIISEESCFPFE